MTNTLTSDALSIRSAQPEDVPRIIELLKESLGESQIPRNESYWTWKHFRSPFGASPTIVAESEGRIVGLRVFMRWRWRRESEELDSVRAVDTATHPEWQGRGIFTRLTRFLIEDVEKEGALFIYNTPNQRSRPGYLKMGWSSLGRTSLWIRPCRPVRILTNIVVKSETANTIPETEHPSEVSVSWNLQSPALDRIIQAKVYDHRLTTNLSKEYLEWRYRDIPEFQYRAAGEWRNGAEALVIYRIVQRGALRELRLSEILHGREAACSLEAAKLIRKIIRRSRPDFVSAMAANSTPEQRVLVRSGFLPAPRLGPILTVRPLASGPSRGNVMRRSAWRFSIGDLELF
jgi:GNAT superfamily N-acetyltransferase